MNFERRLWGARPGLERRLSALQYVGQAIMTKGMVPFLVRSCLKRVIPGDLYLSPYPRGAMWFIRPNGSRVLLCAPRKLEYLWRGSTGPGTRGLCGK